MAKAPAAKPAPAPAPAAPEKSLAEAIREGFAAIPESADAGNRDATKALKKWITDTYPALADAVDSDTFGSTLSGQRKKASGEGAAPRAARGTVATVSGEPTFPEVLKAKEMCEELKMTPAKLLELMETVAKFGDPARLKKCLAYAEQVK